MSPVKFNQAVIKVATRKGFTASESSPFPFESIKPRNAAFVCKIALFADTGKPTISAFAYASCLRDQIEIWYSTSELNQGWIKCIKKLDRGVPVENIASQIVDFMAVEFESTLEN